MKRVAMIVAMMMLMMGTAKADLYLGVGYGSVEINGSTSENNREVGSAIAGFSFDSIFSLEGRWYEGVEGGDQTNLDNTTLIFGKFNGGSYKDVIDPYVGVGAARTKIDGEYESDLAYVVGAGLWFTPHLSASIDYIKLPDMVSIDSNIVSVSSYFKF